MAYFKMKKIIIAVSGLLLLILLAVVLSHKDVSSENQLVTVGKSDFEIRVDTVGTLDAAKAYHVVSALRGDKGKIIQIVSDGAKVAKGDVLVRFDPTPFEAEILRLSGEIKSRDAVAEYARQALEIEKSQADNKIRQSEFDLKEAKQEYGRYQAYITDLEELQTKGYGVGNEVAQAKRKSEQMFTKLQKIEDDFGRIQKEIFFKIAQSSAELNKANSEAETTRNALAEAKTELGKTTVRAELDGFVVLHEIFQGTQKRKPRAGDTIFQGQSILYLPDLSSMIIKTQVREEDLHKIKPGLGAIIRVDAYQDAVFNGEVTGVGILAMENAGTASVGKNFQFIVNLKDSDPRLRPGMTARVSIVTEQVKNALTIPIPALFSEDGRKFCYVFDGKKFIKETVKIGRMNDDVAEIVSGLTEGWKVSLVRP